MDKSGKLPQGSQILNCNRSTCSFHSSVSLTSWGKDTGLGKFQLKNVNLTHSAQCLIDAKLYVLLCISDFQSTGAGKEEAGSGGVFSPL